MKADLVVGVDCGTSGSKAIVWDRYGQRVSEGRSPLPLFQPQPLWHEQPAERWWEATAGALRQAMLGVEPGRIAGLCISHQRETFVPVDEGGSPLRNAILWMDERAGGLLPGLEQKIGGERFHRITGKRLSGNLSAAKIAWLREREPAVFKRADKFLDVHAFLAHRLTGEFRTGWGCADPMGLFDMGRRDWSEEILGVLELGPERFPKLAPTGAVVGRVSAEAARACGLPAGLLVAAGLGDGQASGLGAGVSGPGESYLSLGTSVISGTFAPEYVTSEHFRTMSGGLPGTYFLETVILGGTYTIDWFLEKIAPDLAALGGSPKEALEALARQVPPGCEGLILVPYWNSAMNPFWDARASGIVAGWRGVHQRAHLYRAILEGIAFEQRLHTEGVSRALGCAIERYLAAGGGAASDLWCGILADITGRQVARAGTVETACLGAGMLVAAAAGLHPDVPTAARAMAPPVGRVFEPDPARHAFYSRLYEEVYRELYPALRGVLGRLAEVSG
jgi:xylulokinase